MRECWTLRLCDSVTWSITVRMSWLMLAATDAERVDTSAELSTTPVSSSSCLATSVESAASSSRWSRPSAKAALSSIPSGADADTSGLAALAPAESALGDSLAASLVFSCAI